MHLNINLGSAGRSQFRPSCSYGGQASMMLRMMMHMMQQMMQLLMGQADGCCSRSRPNFGCGMSGHIHNGSPLGGFLGSPGGGFQTSRTPNYNHCHPNRGNHAPPSGHWQQVGQHGELASRLPGPLRQHAGAFEHYGKMYGVDPKFLAAISMLETGQGTSKAFRYKRNAMGVSNRSGPIAFGSVEQSIERMARVLAKKNGPYAGKRTIGQIAGVYCPVGAGNDVNGTNHHWPRMVSKFYTQLGGNPSVAVKA